jgi:hypothetical protein
LAAIPDFSSGGLKVSEPDMSGLSDATLEQMASGQYVTREDAGAARAELTKRQRRYEADRDDRRWIHDVDMFEAEGKRSIAQQEFDERLSRENREHAEKIAKEQLKPALNSARATKLAAVAAALSAFGGIAAATVSGLTYFDQQRIERISGRPLVDFYTEDSEGASKIGIEIQNEGQAPLLVSKIVYFVDGRIIGGHDEAAMLGKLNPTAVDYVDFEPGDKMAAGEKDWLFYWNSADKSNLPKFIDFLDKHLAIGAKVCSQLGDCVSRCSTPGRCGPNFKD